MSCLKRASSPCTAENWVSRVHSRMCRFGTAYLGGGFPSFLSLLPFGGGSCCRRRDRLMRNFPTTNVNTKYNMSPATIYRPLLDETNEIDAANTITHAVARGNMSFCS